MPTRANENQSLPELFDSVVQLIRETPTPDDSAHQLSTGNKLRLYGLYKHIEASAASDNSDKTAVDEEAAPSIFRVEAYAKYQAVKACTGLSREEAMREYISLLSAQENSLGEICRDWWHSSNSVANDGKSSFAKEVETPIDPMLKEDTKASKLAESKDVKHTEMNKASHVEPAAVSRPKPSKHFFGVSPLIPRGQLDIKYRDLLYASRHCATNMIRRSTMPCYQHYERKIKNQWIRGMEGDGQSPQNVIVGLAVRSLLDLYLLSRSFPEGSQIIICPPINVPGMLQVLRHHRLEVVGVDLPPSDETTRNTTTTISVDIEGIEAAITDKTVAILVVHPFGMVSASNRDFERIKTLADQHKLDVMEDCAEIFTGLGSLSYRGSPQADVVFVSFGLIKTSTALGGGIAMVKNIKVAETMKRLHFSVYQYQTNAEYFGKVLYALCIRFVTDFPWMCGMIHQLCVIFRLDFDYFVTSLLRGFGRSPMDSSGTKFDQAIHQFRRRPCAALLALLSYRLQEANQHVPSVLHKKDQCLKITRLLKSTIPNVNLPAPTPYCTNSNWLFPIVSETPGKQSTQLRKLGFDATQGSSQLCCVSPNCKRAEKLMKALLYLPVCGKKLCNLEMKRLVDGLRTFPCNGDEPVQPGFGCNVDFLLKTRLSLSVPLCIFFVFSRDVAFLIRQIHLGIVALGILLVVCIASSKLLRWLVADYYINSSTAVGKYIDLLGQHPDYESHRDISNHSTIPGIQAVRTSVFQSSRALRLPQCSPCERKVILTGATGFIGSLVLRDLLLHRKVLGIKKVILICRSKRGISAQARIDTLLENTAVYGFLDKTEKSDLVKVIEGDVTRPNALLCKTDLYDVRNDGSISHLIHCAASVSFTQSLPAAATANISSPLYLQDLAASLAHEKTHFVHVSTAFVHGGLSGTDDEPLSERLFPLGSFDANDLYSSMQSTEFLASKAMRELRFPNSYTFSKCVCEHLLVKNSKVRTTIFRPSIVGPACEMPFEGWAGQRPTTLVAAACLYLSYQWNLWSFGPYRVSCIPVDVVSRFLLSRAFAEGGFRDVVGVYDSSSDEDFEKVSCASSALADTVYAGDPESSNLPLYTIHNATWDSASAPSSTFTWLDYASTVTQVGSLFGHFGRATAYIGLILSTQVLSILSPSLELYTRIHRSIVKAPLLFVETVFAYLRVDASNIRRLLSFIDLPLLFFPFMNTSFHFRSRLVAKDFDGQRYALNCVLAAHVFLATTSECRRSRNPSKERNTYPTFFLLGGRIHEPVLSDSWWALTQPRGTLVIRCLGFLAKKVLRLCFNEVSVDLFSFAEAIREAENTGRPIRIVLTPTHRSVFDFILLSFLAFSLPELQVDIPFVAAAEDFRQLPIIGWLCSCARAIFIRRGTGQVDPDSNQQIQAIGNHRHGPVPVMEVFIEGTRSRDGRFSKPKTGVLKCLHQSGIDSLIVPVAISYEAIPEQHYMEKELVTGASLKMSTSGALQWLLDVFDGKNSFGNVLVSAGAPLVMNAAEKTNFKELVGSIQGRQRDLMYISRYHVEAISRLLDIDCDTVEGGIKALNMNYWSSHPVESRRLTVPSNNNTLCCAALQVPYLYRFFEPHQLLWVKWINSTASSNFELIASAAPLSTALSKVFDAADISVSKALLRLQSHGFEHPERDHLLKTAISMDMTTPSVLLAASASMKTKNADSVQLLPSSNNDRFSLNIARSKLHSGEALGEWGFEGCGFIVRMGDYAPYVAMKGNRYSLSGKRLDGLLPFIESEMMVKVDISKEAFLDRCDFSEASSQPIDVDSLGKASSFVSISVAERIRHGTGHCQEDIYAIRSGEALRIPDAVAWPINEDHLCEIVSLAKAHLWCVIPFGGGTNVSQATRCPPIQVEPRPIISVDMTQMNRILWVSEENGLAHVEAGITGRALVEEMNRRGFTIGHEPDSYEFSTLGGWIATKASGMKRNKYGNIEDIVRGVRVVGANGVLAHGYKGANGCGREAGSFDITSLIIGSEGCLGVIGSAVIRIWRLPKKKDFGSVLFPDFEHGIRFTKNVSELGRMIPASCRLLDNEHFRLGHALRPESESIIDTAKRAITSFVASISFSLDPKKVVCATILYEGSSEEVNNQKKAIGRLSRMHGGVQVGASIGRAGYELTFMIAYLRDFAMSYHFLGESFETFVPWSGLLALTTATKERILKEHKARDLPGKPFVGCRVTQLYHEGVCLYFYFCMSFKNVASASAVFTEIEHAAREEILEHGGLLSHHHGVGKVRSSFLQAINSPALQEAALLTKHAFDPENIFAARNGAYAS
jgi:alkyldihydroxyacetonephosphate synthase